MDKTSGFREDDALSCARIAEGKMYLYKAREDGTVMRTSKKRFVQSRVKPYLKRGMAAVKVNGRELVLKNLIARHFVEGWQEGAYVETADGDPLNCAASNLRLYTRSEHGRRTGGMNGRAVGVVVNGIRHRSIRRAALSLHVSYQTLLDHMAGKRTVLRGVEVKALAVAGQ